MASYLRPQASIAGCVRRSNESNKQTGRAIFPRPAFGQDLALANTLSKNGCDGNSSSDQRERVFGATAGAQP
jgi:hypothetical protein